MSVQVIRVHRKINCKREPDKEKTDADEEKRAIIQWNQMRIRFSPLHHRQEHRHEEEESDINTWLGIHLHFYLLLFHETSLASMFRGNKKSRKRR